MNLITASWLQARDAQGGIHAISPLMLSEPRYVDVLAPRPDFRGAVYQFLIGLLQLAYAPCDLKQWRDRLKHPPGEAELQAAFAPWVGAFSLDVEGPAFMQDLGLPAEVNRLSVLDLLIDAGSDNNQYFNKPAEQPGFCASCTAQALFTLQINAPSGGRGIRTSLRGGGPLTTLLVPHEDQATLWQRLWLNVLPTEVLGHGPIDDPGKVLPWLAPTRTSDGAKALETTPETVHPLQAYWSMPRRIRLDLDSVVEGDCAICGAVGVPVFRYYRTRHGGTNYTGAWRHPLTPYSLDPKNEAPPLSIKGQPGGIGYRHWLGLALGRDDGQPAAAQVVAHYHAHIKRPPVRLWCFGYDMNNMKARCWYDSTLPVHVVDDDMRAWFTGRVKLLIDVAVDAASALHKQVKVAWFKRPGDAGNEPAIHQSFWQGSEAAFYAMLVELTNADMDDDHATARLLHDWLATVWRTAMTLFDYWTLAGPIEERDLRRVVKARAALGRDLNTGKATKAVWKIVNTSLLKEKA